MQNPQAWRTDGLLFVWPPTFDLSGIGDPTRTSRGPANTALRLIEARSTLPHRVLVRGSRQVKILLKAQVLNRNLDKYLYKVVFSSPITARRMNRGISVSDITSTTTEKKREKKKEGEEDGTKSVKVAHGKKYKLAKECIEDRLDTAHFYGSYGPPEDRNCQFSLVCESLRSNCLYRSVETLREQVE